MSTVIDPLSAETLAGETDQPNSTAPLGKIA